MRRVAVFLAILSVVSIHLALADDDGLEAALAGLTADGIAAHVRTLASDEFEGRAPSTPGEEKSIAYVRDRFVEAGVAPCPDGSYFQEVPLVRKQITGDPVVTVERGRTRTHLELGDDVLLGSPLVAEHVAVDKSDVVFAGFGITAPEYDWDDYANLDVRDKIVMVVMNDPGRTSSDSTFFKGRALSLYGTTGHKQEEAARHGARGLILIHDQDIIGYPWEVLKGSVRQPKFAAVPNANTTAKPPLFVLLKKERAQELLKAAGHDYAELLAVAAQPGFRGFPLKQSMTVGFDMMLSYSVSHNVIGRIAGRERPDEYVVYTAHWDHVGIGAPVDGDSIYNGAIDNATGTAVLIELARAYAALPEPPRRTVVFIATAAEEQGLLGAFHYADNPVFPLARTMAVINMDALFPFGDFNGMTVVAMGSSEVEEYLGDAAALEGRVLEPDPSPEQGAFFRSDHYPFAEKGVPAIFAVGGPASTPEPSPEMMERFNKYLVNGYHKPNDEYDDTWDMRGIVGDARIYFRTGFSIANDDRVPDWYLDSEFRALRDRQRAQAR